MASRQKRSCCLSDYFGAQVRRRLSLVWLPEGNMFRSNPGVLQSASSSGWRRWNNRLPFYWCSEYVAAGGLQILCHIFGCLVFWRHLLASFAVLLALSCFWNQGFGCSFECGTLCSPVASLGKDLSLLGVTGTAGWRPGCWADSSPCSAVTSHATHLSEHARRDPRYFSSSCESSNFLRRILERICLASGRAGAGSDCPPVSSQSSNPWTLPNYRSSRAWLSNGKPHPHTHWPLQFFFSL